ncbi:rho gtpase-activating protein 11a [Lasius niger]|uniref:Rho gtpase-activating protein 11a n=1 Tax=Lasius niger TaxID=67767 RepID=A0A0J7K4L6_LASNI|nr:rho gtpase-activating protein 11a [Lasius niger]
MHGQCAVEIKDVLHQPQQTWLDLVKVVFAILEKELDAISINLLMDFPENLKDVLPSLKDQLKFKKAMSDLGKAKDGRSLLLARVPVATGSKAVIEITDSSGSVTSKSEVFSVTSECIPPAETVQLEKPPPNKRVRQESPDKEIERSNTITELLKKTAKGKAVLKYFQLFGLDKPSRLTIAECIIPDEYGADTNKVISCDQFTTLACLIVEAFPESVTTYYTPSRTRGKGKTASGKLYDNYAILNKTLRKVNLRNTTRM